MNRILTIITMYRFYRELGYAVMYSMLRAWRLSK